MVTIKVTLFTNSVECLNLLITTRHPGNLLLFIKLLKTFMVCGFCRIEACILNESIHTKLKYTYDASTNPFMLLKNLKRTIERDLLNSCLIDVVIPTPCLIKTAMWPIQCLKKILRCCGIRHYLKMHLVVYAVHSVLKKRTVTTRTLSWPRFQIFPLFINRCSQKSRKVGIRHGVFPGEEDVSIPLDPDTNNSDKLYHYRISISPPTNFLVKVSEASF
jgi:hypothetical protein